MNLSEIFFYFFCFSLFLVALEYAYSVHYKKDGIYSPSGTVGNILNGFVLRIFSKTFVSFYFTYALLVYAKLDYSTKGLTIGTFILCFFLVDLFYYFFHRLHHSSFLWVFHRVHHGDVKFNLSTSYRISWLEQVYLSLFFAPILLVGFHPIAILIAYNILSLHQFFCHSQYLRMPKYFDLFFVTPNNHKIHHDQEERHQTSNFGGVFSIWDRLFGTYTKTIPTFTPGIKGYKQDNFFRMQAEPIANYIKEIIGKTRLV